MPMGKHIERRWMDTGSGSGRVVDVWVYDQPAKGEPCPASDGRAAACSVERLPVGSSGSDAAGADSSCGADLP